MIRLRYLKNVVTLSLNQEKCTGCLMCTIVCPHRVFSMNSKRAIIVDRDACMECGACARNCPEGAIVVNAGVGCATAVITSKIKKSEVICCECGANQIQQEGCCC